VERAFSEYGTYATPAQVEDAIVATFRYNNDAVGSISSSTFWRPAKRDEVIIWGTHGALIIEEYSSLKLWSSRRWGKLAPGKEHHIKVFPQVDYTAKWIDRFAIATAKAEPPEITGRDGWINNAVIEAVYKSRDLALPVIVEPFPLKEGL
jgi:predicted dehydrogenase